MTTSVSALLHGITHSADATLMKRSDTEVKGLDTTGLEWARYVFAIGLPVLGLSMVVATTVARKLGPDWDLDIKVPPHKTMPVDEWLASNDPFYTDLGSPKSVTPTRSDPRWPSSSYATKVALDPGTAATTEEPSTDSNHMDKQVKSKPGQPPHGLPVIQSRKENTASAKAKPAVIPELPKATEYKNSQAAATEAKPPTMATLAERLPNVVSSQASMPPLPEGLSRSNKGSIGKESPVSRRLT